MTVPPIAHAGHWLANLLYLVPLLVVIATLGVSSLRDRRAAAAEAAQAPAGGVAADEADASAAP